MPYRINWSPPTVPFRLANVAPLGVTPRVLDRACETERITRLARGVYIASEALAKEPSAAHLQRALAVQLLRPSAIASHHTAALAWGLALDDVDAAAAGAPRFTEPVRPAVRSGGMGGYSITVRTLPPEDRVAHASGLVVTAPARTALDVASTADLSAALVVLDSAVRRELFDLVGSTRVRSHYTRETSLAAARAPLEAGLPRAATQFTRGHLAQVVPWADPRRESALESMSFAAMIEAGLPLPRLQVRISTPEGDFYPDFLWEDAMVIGEADGMGKYQTPEDLVREKRRQEALEQMGYLVIRWDMRELRRNPGAVMERIRAAIEVRTGCR